MMTDQERRETLSRLMDDHGHALFRMCALHLRDVQLAEDAVQETFLKAWRKLDTFRDESSERTWLMRIAINVCRDMLRTGWLRRIDRRVDIQGLPECAQADEYPDRTVLTEVMGLPPKLREVVLLRYYQGMSLKDTADALCIGFSTVKQRQQKDNQILHKRLKEWYFDE